MLKQQSLFTFVSLSSQCPKVSQISEGINEDTVLPALCASSSSKSEFQQQSAIQVYMEAQLEKTIANTASSESNRGLQHTSVEIKICSHPYQPHSQGFPKKRFGQAKPEYRSFKVSWFDNRNWSNWLHWEATRERAYCIICRNVYALRQLTICIEMGN